jgi:hypothetical protein
MEEFFIHEYNTHVDCGHGYNMSYGGDGGNRSSATRVGHEESNPI